MFILFGRFVTCTDASKKRKKNKNFNVIDQRREEINIHRKEDKSKTMDQIQL
jgi:hypothetical protein